tara:strand:- start:496 stop:672 length:177 start_codon:yes stop_codon:yes gene_type:complete
MLNIFKIPLEILLQLEREKEALKDIRPVVELPIPKYQAPPVKQTEEEETPRGVLIIDT